MCKLVLNVSVIMLLVVSVNKILANNLVPAKHDLIRNDLDLFKAEDESSSFSYNHHQQQQQQASSRKQLTSLLAEREQINRRLNDLVNFRFSQVLEQKETPDDYLVCSRCSENSVLDNSQLILNLIFVS